MTRSRSDLPPDLVKRAAEIDTSLLAWLEAAYPTDAEHARAKRRRRGQQSQQELPLVHRDCLRSDAAKAVERLRRQRGDGVSP